jgi:hypothetical protein
MRTLRTPYLPEYNLYESLRGRTHSPNARELLQAIEGTFRKFDIPEDTWTVMGNLLIRFAAVLLVNGDFPIDETDEVLETLMTLFTEMFRRLAAPPPLLKVHCEE